MPLEKIEHEAGTMIETALERFKLAAEADNGWRLECLEDLDFSIGNQWPLTIQTIREKDGRPCLVMDQLQQSIRLVCNQYRQQPPSITVSPVGDGADVETADIVQGIVRHIEVNCDAQVTYEKTHEGMVRAGFHSCRIRNEYVDDDSDEQEVIIEWIKNAFSVYWQPGVPQEQARWCFIVVDIPRDTYKADYPKSQLACSSDWTATGNAPATWINKEYIRVAEYFEVQDVERKGKRPGKKVVWRKITAYETLEGGENGEEIPGTSIPVFTAYGDDIDVDGKRYVAGLVRNAKGPQRQYNYMVSGATEAVSLAPKAPWVAVEGQLAGREVQWEQANVRNFAVLQYKQIDIMGKPAPPPQRMSAEPPIQGIAQMIGQASNDLKASLGLYDPSMGNAHTDQSGKAIQSLQQQGNIATLNYSDNMGRMMKRLGKGLLEWMKVIYDEPRVQRIIMPDSTVKHVVIHNGADQAEAAQKMAQELAAPQNPQPQQNSAQQVTPQQIAKIYDIGVGRYDVVISIEQTYQTKRKEAAATQIDLMKALPPQQASVISDLAVRNMDIPQSNEMADRIKRTQPPQVLGGDDSDPQVQLQQAHAQLQQFSQQHDLLTKALQEAQQVIQTKQVEQQGKTSIAQMEQATKENIVRMQEATKLAVAQINASKDVNQTIAEQEIAQYELLHNAAHDIAMQKDQQEHQQGMAQQAQAAAAQQQQAGQQADQQSQAADQQHQQTMAAQAQQTQGGENV